MLKNYLYLKTLYKIILYNFSNIKISFVFIKNFTSLVGLVNKYYINYLNSTFNNI